MRNLFVFSVAAALVACLLAGVKAQADGDKVDIGKLPKAVVDTLTAKFPKGMLKCATMEKVDGKVFYEVVVNLPKETHVHAVVEANGKLLEIHRHIEPKELPDKVAKAVATKYPKGKIEEAVERTNADGQFIGYALVVELDITAAVIIQLDGHAKILKETKETTVIDAFCGRVTQDGKPIVLPEGSILKVFHEKGQSFGIPLDTEGKFKIGWMPIGEYSMTLLTPSKERKGPPTKHSVPGRLTIEKEKTEYTIELGKHLKL